MTGKRGAKTQNKLVPELWLCEPLYLPPLRGTSFQKEASTCALRAIFLCAFGATILRRFAPPATVHRKVAF